MKRWYVVQVYAGFEDVVVTDLKKRIGLENLSELFGEILVPTGEMSSFSGDEVKKEKILPGYVLVEMELIPAAFKLVMSVPRVSKFLGGNTPMPLSQKEVDRLFTQMSGKIIASAEKISFVSGSEVNIASGPFSGFVGIVDAVDEEHKKLTVMVSIFGRLTPVELGFDQVKH